MARIKAFGIERSLCEWAAHLKMDVADVMYYVDAKGLTIEDLYKIQGREPTRKPRVSDQMVKTQERIALLLEYSGYTDRNDKEHIEVKRVGTHAQHAINFKGAPLGVYNYKTGGLTLSGGEGLPLWDLDFEDAKIQMDARGLWVPHPDTKKVITERHIKTLNKADLSDVFAHYETAAKVEELREPARTLYEGFGKKHTCAEWARVLRVPTNTLWRRLLKGQTIEDFATERGIK